MGERSWRLVGRNRSRGARSWAGLELLVLGFLVLCFPVPQSDEPARPTARILEPMTAQGFPRRFAPQLELELELELDLVRKLGQRLEQRLGQGQVQTLIQGPTCGSL